MADIANNTTNQSPTRASSERADRDVAEPGAPPAGMPVVDATGLRCPMPVLKAQRALSNLKAGDHLQLLSSDPATERELKAYCTQAGHTLAKVVHISLSQPDDKGRADDKGKANGPDSSSSLPPQNAPAVLFEIICGTPISR